MPQIEFLAKETTIQWYSQSVCPISNYTLNLLHHFKPKNTAPAVSPPNVSQVNLFCHKQKEKRMSLCVRPWTIFICMCVIQFDKLFYKERICTLYKKITLN
jgi:hypothetical protein